MDRNSQLEIRRRSAAMTPPGSSLLVAREDLLADIDELLTFRRATAPDEAALGRHPSRAARDEVPSPVRTEADVDRRA